MTQKALRKVVTMVQGWAPGRAFHRVWIRSDGAPSHFKNRFTVGWLGELKLELVAGESGFRQAWWDFSAPQHGKGPWDGLGALIKNYIRELIRLEQKSFNGAKAVFDFLSGENCKFHGDCWSSHAKETFEHVSFVWIGHFDRPSFNCTSIPAIRPVHLYRSHLYIICIACADTHRLLCVRRFVDFVFRGRSSFMFNALPALGMVAVRAYSCYCDFCKNETWVDPIKAATAEHGGGRCANLDTVGPWRLVKMTRTDAAAYNRRLLRNRTRGKELAREISDYVTKEERIRSVRGDPAELKIDKSCLREDEHLVVVRFDLGKGLGFSFRLARLTETLQDAPSDLKGFKTGEPIVCVQYLNRSPIDSPNNFELGVGTEGMTEQFVSVKALRKVDVLWLDADKLQGAVRVGPRTRAARLAASSSSKKITKVFISDKEILAIHTAIEELEAEVEVGRWKA